MACVATALVGLGGFLFGYDIGIISGVLVMPSFLTSFPGVASDAWTRGFVVTSFLIGGCLGAAFSGWLAGAHGRRATLRAGAALFIVGGLCQVGATTLPALFAARGVSGLAIGLTAAVVPIYAAELAPASQRGMMISFNQINITGGIMVSFWVNYWLKGIDPPGPGFQLSGWRIAMLLQCVPALVLLLGSLWLPRSPRWLAQQGRTTEALSALQRLRGAGDVADAELQQIVADCSGSSGGTAPWSDFLYDAPSRRRLLCGVVLQTGQMLCGIDSIMFYGPQIFAQAAPHIQNADLLAQGINGVVNFLSTFVAVFLLDKVGRRPLLGAGAAIQASCMLTLATVGVLYARIETNTGSSTGSSTGSEAAGGDAAGLVIEHRSAGVVCILAIYLFVSAFAWSWGPVVWALCVEVFPTRQRVRGVSITTTVNWLFNIVVGQLYPPAQQALGFRIFFVFGGVSVLLSAWVLWSAPETKGLSIDQVETLFERPADAGRLAGRQRRESFRSLPATTGTHAPLLQ